MAGATVPISFPTETVTLARAVDLVKNAKTVTDQLRDSTKKLGTDTASAGRQVSSTLEGMNLKLQQLRGQINNTSQANTAQLQKLSAEYRALQAEIDKTNKKLFEQKQGWDGLISAAKIFIAARIVKEIGDIALSMASLKGNVEGVSAAFSKLPNAVLLLNNIRSATHGTIDDFKLMQLALKAENFGVPLRQLGSLLEFAAVRAQQTGISVDYLTESIITGIGRKSIKILDNLQINIADLNHRVKDLGVSYGDAVGQIANEQLQKMGGFLKTSKTEVEQLTAGLETMKQLLSVKLSTGWFAELLNDGVRVFNDILKGVKELNKETAAGEVNRFLSSKSNELANREKVVSTIFNEIERRKNLIQAIKDETGATQSKVDFYISKHDPAYQSEINRLQEYKKAMNDRKAVLLESIPLLQGAINTQLQAIAAQEKEIVTIETMQEKLNGLLDEYRKEVDFGDRVAYIAKAKQIRQLQEEIARREELLNIKKEDSNIIQTDKLEQSMVSLDNLFKAWSKLDDAVIPTLDNIETDTKETVDDLLTEWDKFFGHFVAAWNKSWTQNKKTTEQAIRDIQGLATELVTDLLMNSINGEVAGYERRIQNAQDYYDRELQLAGNNAEAKKIIERRRNEELKRLEKQKQDAETRAAQRKIVIEGNIAVARAFADYEWPYSLIVAGLVAASVISEYNAVSKAPRGYAKGVIDLKGPGTGTSDSINARLSKGESVMTAQETRDNYRTLHAIRAGKLNDKVIEKIIQGQINVVGSDDHETAAKLDELIKVTKANRKDDLVEKHGMLYRVRQKGENSKRYIRSKYGNF